MSRKSMGCATARLKQDYLRLKKDPVPYVQAEPVPSNILEWHYVITGPENTPYQGGYYHGKLIFPREFPFQPPSIYMITPNGRFKTNTRLCLSISDFHPDTWNPAWNVSTILIGLLSFMIENGSALGAITTLEYEKKVYAAQSLAFNLKDKLFCELFPETVTIIETELERRKELETKAKLQAGSNRTTNTNQEDQMDQSHLQTVMSNFLIVIGLALFAIVVKYVLRNIKTQEYVDQ
ncbi:ubiquitin-conjugating enzyme E2 J2 [Trichogramma pretiosum]|uniref:ubiquitin-conjugating enzyme E2 J2 n=1 Tax=Trichogramma pretiosum TaxID=7493 RepID=UPI0006C953A9|nr:ubiquitin-conjugating enzyme E2 J2 [Trichogramma pretiosum]